jgi:hypothetical protein
LLPGKERAPPCGEEPSLQKGSKTATASQIFGKGNHKAQTENVGHTAGRNRAEELFVATLTVAFLNPFKD